MGNLICALPPRILDAGSHDCAREPLRVDAGAPVLIVARGGVMVVSGASELALRRWEAAALSMKEDALVRPSYAAAPCVCDWLRFEPAASGREAALPERTALRPDSRALAYFYHILEKISPDSGANPVDFGMDYLLSHLLLLLSTPTEAPKQTGLAAQLSRYIQNNYHHNITFDELCARFPYSRDYLARVLRADGGQSLHDRVHSLRVAEARRLLVEEMDSVKEIAWKCGYPNEKMFMQRFRRITGMTPSEYRRVYEGFQAEPDD